MQKSRSSASFEWSKITQWMLVFTIFLCVVAAFLTKKPHCINSSIVDSLDRMEGAELSRIWSCRQAKATPYDARLWKFKRSLDEILKRVEARLDFKKPLTILIREDRPSFYKVSEQHIEIGPDLLARPRVFERSLYKAWIKQIAKTKNPVVDLLTEEVLADLLVFSQAGELEHFQNESHIWPTVIKSAGGYCTSRWMSLEHSQFCALAAAQDQNKMSNFTDLSLRPLLSTSLARAYVGLSVRDQLFLPEALEQFLKKEALVNSLHGNFSGLHHKVELFADQLKQIPNIGARFAELFKNELQGQGFVFDESQTLQLEMAYIVSGRLDPQSSLFSDMADFSKKETKQRLAIIDRDYIWLLPSLYPLKRSLFPRIHVKNSISQFCGWPRIADLTEMKSLTDRILVVNSCKKTSLRISGFAMSGAEAFARQNAQVAFAQFHMPSIELYQKIKGSDEADLKIVSQEAKGLTPMPELGQNRPQWVDSVKAYRVRGAIDAVEWYRMIN